MSDFLVRLAKRNADIHADAATVVNTGSTNLSIEAEPIIATGQEEPTASGRENTQPTQHEAYQRRQVWMMKKLLETGLFDRTYYLETYPDIAQAGIDPFEHFFFHGFKENRRPNPYFEPIWYLQTYPDVVRAGMNPLFHYALHGDVEGRNPGPLFAVTWYREKYKLEKNVITLKHYLDHRKSGAVSPIPDFDAEFYTKNNPDILAAEVDPFEHFINSGYREGRNPSSDFDVNYYVKRHLNGDLNQNPFFHWLSNKGRPGISGRMPDDEASIPREIKRFTKQSPDFEEFQPLPETAPRRAKILAYYLPQFHTFEENDEWWGKGFTEWTNIPRGVPRFAGHYQPRVPRDLGHYVLDSNDPMRRQIQMAKAGGVYGFILYYYWFNGKRLMDKPLERFLADPTLDMPFTLMWANENWTRRWDGAESEVLISQDYRPSDDEEMVGEFARYMKDSRYIRVQGRPLLTIYRPGVIPDSKRTVERWRTLFREQHAEDPILLMAQAFGDIDPAAFDLDGAIEFPPHKLTQFMPPANNDFNLLDAEFTGKIYHYDAVIQESLRDGTPSFPLIKTAVPSWDNDARRQGTGLVITGSTPDKYERWLSELIDRAERVPFFEEPFVCINAWNEWCEGTYLEPDLHFGSAYLNATGRAACGIVRRAESAPKLLLVGHDAFPSGAQHLLLNIGRRLKELSGLQVEFLLLDGGRLQADYARIAPTHVVKSEADLNRQIQVYRENGYANALVNTSAAAHVIPTLAEAGIGSVLLVHELPRIIQEKNLGESLRKGFQSAKAVVFPATYVRDNLLEAFKVSPVNSMPVLPQGTYKTIRRSEDAAADFRRKLNIADRDSIVIGIGYADLRKGFDLFLHLWQLLQKKTGPKIHLCWIGGIDPDLASWLSKEIKAAVASGTFHMVGYSSDIVPALSAAVAFALTSREDPFPTVVLEAASAGLPVIAFEDSGGMPEAIRTYSLGHVAPHGDVPAMAKIIGNIIKNGEKAEAREGRIKVVEQQFSFDTYVEELRSIALPGPVKISVAVPNYNYARYMPERLGSIFRQTYPISELLVLDDKSKDDSLLVIPAIAADWRREIKLVPNEVNSGSVFAQWRKAAELASGDWLWIAEADDTSHPLFLEGVMQAIGGDPSVVLAFSDSRTIHVDGKPQWSSYKGYYEMVEPGALSKTEIFTAGDFVERFLCVRNLILNVSSVVWNRRALLRALDACAADLKTYKMAGDWRLYLQALSAPGAKIAYCSEPPNVHRRHAESVTHALAADKHVNEIEQCHVYARQALGGSEAIALRQRSYLVEVAKQLGAVPVVTKNVKAPSKNKKSRPL